MKITLTDCLKHNAALGRRIEQQAAEIRLLRAYIADQKTQALREAVRARTAEAMVSYVPTKFGTRRLQTPLAKHRMEAAEVMSKALNLDSERISDYPICPICGKSADVSYHKCTSSAHLHPPVTLEQRVAALERWRGTCGRRPE